MQADWCALCLPRGVYVGVCAFFGGCVRRQAHTPRYTHPEEGTARTPTYTHPEESTAHTVHVRVSRPEHKLTGVCLPRYTQPEEGTAHTVHVFTARKESSSHHSSVPIITVTKNSPTTADHRGSNKALLRGGSVGKTEAIEKAFTDCPMQLESEDIYPRL